MQRYIVGQQATELWAGKLQSITVKLQWRHLWPDKHPSYCCFSSLDNSSGEENKWLGRICSVWKFASLKQLRHAMLLWCLLFWVGVILIRNAWGELARKKRVVSSEHHASIAFCACCSTGREFASILRPKCPGPSRVQLLWWNRLDRRTDGRTWSWGSLVHLQSGISRSWSLGVMLLRCEEWWKGFGWEIATKW